MCISIDGKLTGIVSLTDILRSDAAQTVAHLQMKGYTVHMLSGKGALLSVLGSRA